MYNSFDIIIVGGGSAGCVLAGRLSADPTVRVLLLEAGPDDDNFLIRMPKGNGKLLADPRYCHYFETAHDQHWPGARHEVWLRGKVLGGSSAVNGMVYHRGQPEDYDRFEELGLKGWGWKEIQACFVKLENHQLQATAWRGQGGPIDIRIHPTRTELSEAMLQAGKAMGLPMKEEPNLPKQEGISYMAHNINSRGERVSAARGFLTPEVRRRPNLRIETQTSAERILFEGKRAVGVLAQRGEQRTEYRASREVILCTGAIQSPQLLQVSGVGPAELLQSLSIPVVYDSPDVGGNMREHWTAFTQFRLRHWRDSENRQYTGWRLIKQATDYFLRRKGLMAESPWSMVAFVRAWEGSKRPDSQLSFAQHSLDLDSLGKGAVMEKEPGMQFFGYPLRGTSQGTVRANSADMRQPPRVDPNYLDTEYDRTVSIALVRYIRRFMAQPALAPYVAGETAGTGKAQSDDEILDMLRLRGQSGYHASGTCRMGIDDKAVLDERLRVRGVSGLRVMDASVFPEQVSANTNGPVMAMAWRAADLIIEDLRSVVQA
jgi:choline dehydrogenase